jgi:hypothetical protein
MSKDDGKLNKSKSGKTGQNGQQDQLTGVAGEQLYLGMT